MIGRRLGPYRIEAHLGTGAMGAVYRAVDTALDRPVAIKIIAASPDDTGHPDRLRREARAASALNHPNICTIHHVGDENGTPYIVMELVQGKTLQQLIPDAGLAPEVVMRYGIELAAALAHAHDHGVTHGDLSTRNVMVADEGPVKVLDFGLARRAQGSSLEEITQSASHEIVAGTMPYMAPELFEGRRPDPRSDIWAAGVLLHQMSAGQPPFRGRTAFELASAILRDQPGPLPPGLISRLQAVVGRCLAKEAAQRYHNGGELRAALEAVRDTSTGAVSDRRTDEGERGVAKEPRWRRTRSPMVLVGIVAIAVIASVTWLVWPRDSRLAPRGYRLLSTFAGDHSAATLSPDGSMIAFISDAAAVPQVWVKNLAEGDPIQITFGDVPAARPRWSPSNDRIVFARRGQGIWVVPPYGGTPRRIVEQGANPDLSADGATLVFETEKAVWIADANGRNVRRLDTVPVPKYTVEMAPAIAPKGDAIVVFIAEIGPNGDFWVVPVGGGPARRLTSDTCEGGSAAWTGNGERIVFSSARRGSRTLWQVDSRGGQPQPVTSGAGDDLDPAISGEGGRLAYTNARNTWKVAAFDVRTRQQRVLLEKRTDILWPMVSPSGKKIAFFGRSPLGDVQIFAMDADGSGIQQVTTDRGEINTMPQWAGDSSAIYFYQLQPTTTFRRIALGGGASTEVAPWNWLTQFTARPSPDDQAFAYVLHRADRTKAALIHDRRTGRATALPVAIHHMRWSRDGRRLLGDYNDRLYMCSASAPECESIGHGTMPMWSADETLVYFLRRTSPEHVELWELRVADKRESKLGMLGRFRPIDVHVDLLPPGEVIWAPFEAGRRELWLAELK